MLHSGRLRWSSLTHDKVLSSPENKIMSTPTKTSNTRRLCYFPSVNTEVSSPFTFSTTMICRYKVEIEHMKLYKAELMKSISVFTELTAITVLMLHLYFYSKQIKTSQICEIKYNPETIKILHLFASSFHTNRHLRLYNCSRKQEEYLQSPQVRNSINSTCIKYQ